MNNAVLKLMTSESEQHSHFTLREARTIDSATETARAILKEVMNFRRVPKSSDLCGGFDCQDCSSLHLPKIISAVRANQPVTFVLPSFPGKSPNLEKVLGPLPDFAEQLALNFLGNLCRRIKSYYTPGIKIVLCSDGRVFSDVVGMKDIHVTAYQMGLKNLIETMGLNDLMTFSLEDFYKDLSFTQMVDEVMHHYGSTLYDLKQKIHKGAAPFPLAEEQEAHRMFCGVTRFLFEDSLFQGQTKSRSALQKEARTKAYELIRRSNAWGALIAERFPDAVRLSIHPQTCGSKKLGIRLIDNESWMTPWHGVAVETSSGYVLLKRSQAERMGAELIHAAQGLPSHFRLLVDQQLPLQGGTNEI
jgi:pyoverdine/dityrosine biosynthesis protein Dit1